MQTLKKKLICLSVLALPLLTTAQASFASSPLATGTQKLITDVMTFTTVLCPVAGGLAAVYFLIRRGVADEQDGKLWSKRIVVAIGCGVGGALVSGVISMLASYY